jgi:colanic acid/amylovoran biosynthesis glycosyltransferase
VRICLLVKKFPVISQTFVVDQVTGLLERGHDVTVVTLSYTASGQAAASVPSWQDAIRRTRPAPAAPTGPRLARLTQFGAILAREALSGSKPLRFALSQPTTLPEDKSSRLMAASRVARAEPFDLLHAQFGPAGMAAIAMRDAGVFDAPVLCSFHGFDAHGFPAENPGCYDRLRQEAARVTAGTAFMRGEVEKLGFPADKITVWPQGVDLGRFAPPAARRRTPSEFRVLTVARLVDSKGVDTALRAIALARARIPGLTYTVIGDGELRPALEALARDLAIDDITTFAGALPHDAIVAALHDAAAFLLTARTDQAGHTEGQGVAVIEASASELPVVVTRSGGLAEVVIERETGLVVDPDDVPATADALVELAQDEELCARLGAAGREFVQAHYSREASLDIIEQAYALALPGKI